MKTQDHLPIFGVGPLYGGGVIATALAGTALSAAGALPGGTVQSGPLRLLFLLLGIALLVLGACVWAPAALGSGSIDRYIRTNTLCTTGVYRYVRNPCYSGIMLFFTGVLLLARNFWLLLLPPLYWLSMTLLMQHTEEKWLEKQYGDAYRDYCRHVNRCLPWFPKKR